jgi:Right handed beta helix region
MALEFSVKKYKKARIGVLAAFIVVTLILVSAQVAIPKIKSYAIYLDHAPIAISGNDQFTKRHGVVGGSGTEPDPFVIEGWLISGSFSAGISLVNTDSHVLIRNVTVSGSGYSSYYNVENGIELRNASNVIIEDSNIRNTHYGILVQPVGHNYSQSVHILNSTIQNSDENIYLGGLVGGSVERCEIKISDWSSVVVENCSSVSLSSNNILRYHYYSWYYYSTGGVQPDVVVLDSSNITLEGNLVDTDYAQYERSASFSRCSNVTISGNYFVARDSLSVSSSDHVLVDNNTCEGLSFADVDTCTIADNTVRGYSAYDDYYSPRRPVAVSSATDLRILRNRISFMTGLQVHSTSDAEIAGNIVTNCSSVPSITGSRITMTDNLFQGLDLSGDHLTLRANDITLNTGSYGAPDGAVQAYKSNWLNITDNSIVAFGGGYALVFYENENFIIANNSFGRGIEAWQIQNGNVTGNEFHGPADFDFYGGLWSNIRIVHNSMYNISVHNVSAGTSLAWDGGYPYGGNYWSQYSDVDAKSGANQNQPGSDGIGDSPYVITLTDIDEYPLITPVVLADTSPPITASFITGIIGDSGWYRSEVNFTLMAYDDIAGVNSTFYRIDGTDWTKYSTTVLISEDGAHTLEYYSVDNASNSESFRKRNIWIDTEAPQPLEGMTLEYRLKNTNVITMPILFSDNTSGIRELLFTPVEYYRGDFYTPGTTEVQVGFSNGSYVLAARAYDEAGNIGGVRIYVNSSMILNRDPTSEGGPYWHWFNFGIFIDIALMVTILWLSSVIAFGPSKPGPPGKQPGELDRADIEDGYPKYLKRA